MRPSKKFSVEWCPIHGAMFTIGKDDEDMDRGECIRVIGNNPRKRCLAVLERRDAKLLTGLEAGGGER